MNKIAKSIYTRFVLYYSNDSVSMFLVSSFSAVSCGSAPSVLYAASTSTGDTYQQTTQYTCDSGHSFSTTDYSYTTWDIQCQANKTWEHVPHQCYGALYTYSVA